MKAITGVYAGSDLECRRLEADLPLYRKHSNQLIAIAYEKGTRMPPGHPRRDAIDNSTIEHRLKKRSSFCATAKPLTNSLSTADAPRRPITLIFPEPWKSPPRNWTVTTNLDIKSDIPAIGQRIDHIAADVVIYTDGSCTGGYQMEEQLQSLPPDHSPSRTASIL